MLTVRMSLPELIKRYDCEEKCRSYLEQLRWPNGPVCPKCSAIDVLRVGGRNRVLRCQKCNHQFTVTVGTIFHDSHLPLSKWFMAVYFLCESKKGMSALQLQRTLGTGYKTAWYLCHRIRQAMMNHNGNGSKLSGIVEIDDTYIGGRQRGRGTGRGTANKSVVVGMVERGGQLRLAVVSDLSSKTIQRTVRRYVSKDIELIISDELNAYVPSVGSLYPHKHKRIKHSQTFVEGNVYTNSIENAFSLLKRGIVGTWHKVSVKHLQRYLDEVAFRFSQRKNPALFSITLQNILATRPMAFTTLTKN